MNKNRKGQLDTNSSELNRLRSTYLLALRKPKGEYHFTSMGPIFEMVHCITFESFVIFFENSKTLES